MDAAAIASLGTILGVWAHPDDETWTAAGLLMAAAKNGQRVAIVTATRGELGTRDPLKWPLKTLGAVREQEMAAAVHVLGIKEHYWLDYPDGGLDQIPVHDALRQLDKIIQDVAPDSILTFGPEGLTGHSDHQAVGHWAQQASTQSILKPTVYQVVVSAEQYESVGKASDKLLHIYFNTTRPPLVPEANVDICFRLAPDLLDQKISALRAHLSQYEKLLEYIANGIVSPDILTPECFIKAKT